MSQEQVIEHEITRRLRGICESGRESLSESVYTYHMLILLWIKYRSDAIKEVGECVEENLYYFKQIELREVDFEEIYRERHAKYIGHMMNEYVRMIFEEVDFGNRYIFGKDSILLKEMIEEIGELDLRPSVLKDTKMLSKVCRRFTKRIIEQETRMSGIEYIPEEVAGLMTQIMGIQEHECVYDPCCGAGGLLLEASKLVDDSKGYLYGETSQGMMKDLAKINFIFEGQTNYTVLKKNSLMTLVEKQPKIYNKFDVSMSNIRFSKHNWTDELRRSDNIYEWLTWGVPSASGIEYAYISHMLHALKEGGRMAVIVHHGVLFRGGREQKIREELIKQNLLDAVIGLPSNLFNRSSIAVCLLIFKKNRVNQDVLFIDASSEMYYQKERMINHLTEAGIQSIIKTYQMRQTLPNTACTVTYEQIQEKDFNLNIENYIIYEQEEEKTGLNELKQWIVDCEEKRGVIHKQFEECVEKLLTIV